MPKGIYERPKNKIEIDKDNPDKAIIYIKSKTHGHLEAYISASRIDLVKEYTWFVHKMGNGLYVETNARIDEKWKTLNLHRLLTGNVKGMDVDHRDGNPLNNQDENLRVCTHQENMMNQGSQKNSSSKYCGVYWRKSTNKWLAIITIDGKNINLGYFTSEIEAARVRDRAAIKYRGSFARTNFPLSDYK